MKLVMKMEIKRVVPSGYCQGVIRAIRMVQDTVNKYPDKKIYVLGMIVHNRYIVDAFNNLGVITLEDPSRNKSELLDDIDDGVVVFTAHGISEAVKNKAIKKGLIVVDAACTYVLKNMALIKEYLNNDYDIIYIGKKKHPESVAALSISERIHLVTNNKDIDELDLTNANIMVTNQTTMSVFDTKEYINHIKEKYPEAVVLEEICDATRQRQKAVMDLKDADTLIIVGDPASNNTAQLTRLGKLNGIERVIQIESAADLKDIDLTGSEKIAVTSGASTPRYLTDNTINYLKTKNPEYLETDISQILK